MNLSFSFIIPVYNRPNEIKELLDSLRLQTYDQPFEVVIVEDGSTISSEEVTGGIRGGKRAVDKFQPRSFNMGISKEAFENVGGYGNIHPGEDPDLTIRIWNKGYRTKLISEAFVYHKRRIDWNKFYIQVNKFGMVRPILNKWHPETKKVTYWFPTVFCLGFILALILVFLGFKVLWFMYCTYFLVLFIDALLKTRNIKVSFLALLATAIQFFGYGYGFLKSTLYINFSNKEPEEIFPKLFFRVK